MCMCMHRDAQYDRFGRSVNNDMTNASTHAPLAMQGEAYIRTYVVFVYLRALPVRIQLPSFTAVTDTTTIAQSFIFWKI